MENAVKALLIAAAVLIAILLISMVMGVFNTGAEQINNADLSDQETQQFNDKFLQYVGTNLSGSKVNALLKTVHNHNNVQEDDFRKVEVDGNAVDVNTNSAVEINDSDYPSTTSAPSVSTGRRYDVEAFYEDDGSLLVSRLQIDVAD